MNVPILTYHSWLRNGENYRHNNHYALDQDLKVIANLGLVVVPLEQIVDALLCRRLHELENRVGISFDDGSLWDVTDPPESPEAGQSSFLTILREHGRERFTHGTSFVVACGRQAEFESEDPDRPGQDVTDAWLKAERSGYIKIENHSWSHGRQIPDDLEAAMSEIARASDMIDAILGPGYCRLFAYPYGQHNEYLAREFFPNFKARHRMKAAFASEPRPVSINDDRWRLPRFVCGRDWCSADELRALLVDSSPQARVVVPKVAAERPATDTRYASYRTIWDFRARSDQAAMASVDGSASEEALQLTGAYTARQVRTALNLGKKDTVLELGCGVGRIGRELAPHGGHWVGADVSTKMLEVAGRRLSHLTNVEFLHLKRSALTGLANNRLDRAYSVAVFCHLDKEDMFLYLQELCRVLKPGGLLYYETWNLAHPVGWQRWAYEVRHWSRSPQTGRKDVSRNQFSVPEEVRLMTTQAGLEIIACYTDSPWIQMIAIKPGGGDFQQARGYQSAHAAEVAFSDQFTQCFSRQLDLVYGAIRPTDFLGWLNEQDNSETIDMYRKYLMALWQAKRGKWGPPPIN